jgi:FG-GAP repeat
MRIAVGVQLFLRLRYVLVLVMLAAFMAAVAPTDAQTLLRPLDTPNPQEGAYFGHSVAVGDVNDDGKADIAVGAPWEAVGGNDYVGRVYVFSGADGSLLHTLDTPNPQVEDRFGTSLAAGDVNDDGNADIAVGAYWEDVGGNVNQGRAYVFSGADGSLLHTLDTPNPQADAGFGFSLSAGDVNYDGKADIAVGAPWADVGGNDAQGRAYVFSGADWSLLHTLDTPNPQADDRFGYALAVGDVNGDGKGDVAVGTSREDAGGNIYQGRAYIFSGANGSLLFTLDTPNPQAQAGFGYSMAVGDMNGDGKADIAAGAPSEDVDPNVDQGRIYLFSGVDGSLLFTLDNPNPQAQPYFGLSLATGDVNGDAKAEVAVGAPYEHVDANSDQGRAYVFSGANGSLLFTLDIPSPLADAEFGYSLAVGEVNSDGRGEIAVGAAGETVGGIEQAGRAYVYSFPGAPSGSHRRSNTPTPTPMATSTPVPSATPIPPPLATPTPIGVVGPSIAAPSTGSGGGSSTPGGSAGWLYGAYAALASGVVVVVGGWYVRSRRHDARGN